MMESSAISKTTQCGPPLLMVREAMFYALVGVLAGPPMVLVSLLAPSAKLSVWERIASLLFGLLLSFGGIYKLRNRPLLLEITGHGVMIHANVLGVCTTTSLLRDLFVPWQRVERMYYLDRDKVQARGLWLASGGTATADPVIVIALKMDETWPPNGTWRPCDSLTRNTVPGEIYINALQTTPNKTQLWNQLQAIAKRYGVLTSA